MNVSDLSNAELAVICQALSRSKDLPDSDRPVCEPGTITWALLGLFQYELHHRVGAVPVRPAEPSSGCRHPGRYRGERCHECGSTVQG